MNKTEYLKSLGRALVSRGMSKETAEYHMRALSMSVSERDLVGRRDEEVMNEIYHLADSISLILKNESGTLGTTTIKPSQQSATPTTQVVSLPEYVSPDSVVPVDFDAENVPRGDEIDELVGKTKAQRIRDEKPVAATSAGLSGASAKVTLFILLYVFMIIVRIAFVLLLIAITISGVTLFAVGFVYGITQLFSFKGAAYYEMGLSLIIGGVSLALGVVVYNVISNFIPLFQKWIKKRIRIIRDRMSEARSEYDNKRRSKA